MEEKEIVKEPNWREGKEKRGGEMSMFTFQISPMLKINHTF